MFTCTILDSVRLDLSSSVNILQVETFRFKDENDYEYEILLEVSSRLTKIWTPLKASFYHFSLEKLALLLLVKEATPSPDRKMIKLLTFDNLCSLLRHSR